MIYNVGMSSISKPDHCTERPNLVLLSAYQEYLMTFKLMTSQVVQRAQPLIMRICIIGIQRVKHSDRIRHFYSQSFYSQNINYNTILHKSSLLALPKDRSDREVGKKRKEGRKEGIFAAFLSLTVTFLLLIPPFPPTSPHQNT